MANLEQIVSRKAENDTKWKEAQQAERENTTAMQDAGITEITRSEERRVGKECRSRWSPYH